MLRWALIFFVISVIAGILGILEAEGIRVHLNTTCRGFSREGENVTAQVQGGGASFAVGATHVLVATGRRPRRSGTRSPTRGRRPRVSIRVQPSLSWRSRRK